MNREREGYIGIDDALSDETNWYDTYAFVEFNYALKLSDKLNIAPKVYYDYYNSDAWIESSPEGYLSGAYPDGIKAVTRYKEQTIGV